MASELYLVRHAQAGQLGGDYDRLSERGRRQAEVLGTYLAEQGLAFDRVACGSLERQVATIEILQAALECTPAVETLPGLDEFDFGNVAEAYFACHPRPADVLSDRRVFFRTLRKASLAWSRDELPREILKESWEGFGKRVGSALEALADPDKAKCVLAVSSGGAICRMLGLVLDLAPEAMINLNLQTKNTGISRFIFTGKAIYLHSFNGAPHLETPARRALVTYA